MTQEAALEFPQVLEREQYLGECSPSPSVAALNGTLRSIQRSGSAKPTPSKREKLAWKPSRWCYGIALRMKGPSE